MRPQQLIARKRDGFVLSRTEIEAFVDGVTAGSWTDYQISAMIMAMYLNELNPDEQSYITNAMLHSGDVLDMSFIDLPKSDKHSTGGVGDKTSLLIAPMVASCGIAVPMISGRGLGHTGGTLDKLESIPGYNVNLTTAEFKRITKEVGFAMSGQTADIAPADKKIYALRDATATVGTVPLIVASIMSKKLAEGLDSLVLDVKTGNGAFMEDISDARRLAKAMVRTGNDCGVKTKALVTEMSEPLGEYVGNAHEVYECIRILRDEASPRSRDLVELTLSLAAQMLMMSGATETEDAARERLGLTITDGSALERLRLNIETQGGDPRVCDNPEMLLTKGLFVGAVTANRMGQLSGIDSKGVGLAIVDAGGGRVKADDEVDPAVGFKATAFVGDSVKENDELGVLYCRSEEQFLEVSRKIIDAYEISNESVERVPLIHEVVE